MTEDLGAVRAKMQCHTIETSNHAHNFKAHKVRLGAVYGNEGENKDFADATPAGECWMQINEGRAALNFFKPGEKYYVTFTKAPD